MTVDPSKQKSEQEAVSKYFSHTSQPLSGVAGPMAQGPVSVPVHVVKGVSITTQSATGRTTAYPPLATAKTVESDPAPKATVLPSRPISARQAARIAARAVSKSIPEPAAPQAQVLPGLIKPQTAPAETSQPKETGKPKKLPIRSIRIRPRVKRKANEGYDPEEH